MSGQSPDSSLSVAIDHGVGGCVLFPNLYDLSIFGSYQDFTLNIRKEESDRRMRDFLSSINDKSKT